MLRGLFMLFRMRGALRLAMRLMFDRRVPLGLKLIIPAAIAYLISPYDLVPDILPVRGRIDDILVLVGALGLFLGMAPKNVVAEHIQGTKRADSRSGQVIEGSYEVIDDGEDRDR